MKKFHVTPGIFFILISFGGQTALAEEVIRYVTVYGAGSKNGTSWDNAYDGTQLQTAINESGVTQVWVAKGTYIPNGTSRGNYFALKNNCTVYGGFAGTESSVDQRTNYRYGQTNETILSADLGSYGRCYQVIRCFESPTSNAIIDGITIRDGYADRWGYDTQTAGGGIYIKNATLTVRNCTFINNYAMYNGGGIYIEGLGDHVIQSCTFLNNSAGSAGGGARFHGTGVAIISCKFSNNSAPDGGGIYSYYYSSITVTNCVFSSNSASSNGGGLYPETGGSATLNNCTFSGNSAVNGGGIYNGSAIDVRNCIIWGNDASSNGDELYNYGTTNLLYTCYANESGDIYGSMTTDPYCITSDPQFVGSSNNPSHPYSIGGISPCADAGNNDYCSESYDIRGSGFGRKLNKTTGASGTIDMGAYEYKVGTDASLPVTLTDFFAQSVSGAVLLSWTTESETENLGFIIEKRLQVSGNWLPVVDYRTETALQGHGSTSEKHEYQFTDKAVTPGTTYLYRLADVDYSGKVTWHKEVEVKVEAERAQIPEKFGLQPVYPNPFNSALTLTFSLVEDALTTLTVYNLRGEIVDLIADKYFPMGYHSLQWIPQNLTAGVYIIRLESGNQTSLKKVVFVK